MPLSPVMAGGPLARRLLLAASALALATSPATALAQHAQHPGMKMPEKKPSKKKPVVKKQAEKKAVAKKPARKAKAATPAKRAAPDPAKPPIPPPVDHPVDHGAMGHAPVAPPAPAEAPVPPPVDHSQMAHPPATIEHAGHAMTGVLGPYPRERESSGTAWQPDRSEHMGLMRTSGDWTLMGHGVLNLVYDHQSGPRGDDKAFASGMLMGMARRPLSNGTLQLKASVSPDPLMGKRGYPLLLASGETADGETHLVDRQHPHDFFMELSASVSQNIGPKSSVFLYGALPGEPAFGPPAFMHREAIMDSPEAPISHHWLNSTHVSFGVVTAGIVLDRVKIEASRFNGREPDQHRWNLETAPLDSTAARLSFNPTAELSLQTSWGRFKEPEQLEPGVDQTRWSASALYADEIAPGWKLAATLSWGRMAMKHDGERHKDDAYALEASLKHEGWTLFGRGEITENRELLEHGPAFRVGKLSAGAVRDFRVAEHLKLGVGGLFAVNFVPDGLAPAYGGHHPTGAMAFVRLKLD